MESKCLKFLLNESEINKIAKEVGLCTRIRKFTPMELLKMAVFSSNNIAKDILSDILHNIFETSDIEVPSGKCGITTLRPSILSKFKFYEILTTLRNYLN
ncbi:MAG: hypothetical protein ACRC5T_08085 [Cetobacterium sp.]